MRKTTDYNMAVRVPTMGNSIIHAAHDNLNNAHRMTLLCTGEPAPVKIEAVCTSFFPVEEYVTCQACRLELINLAQIEADPELQKAIERQERNKNLCKVF